MSGPTPFLGLDDLNTFRSSAAQDNFLMQLAPQIAAPHFDTRTWTPETTAGVNFAQAFLSAALGQIGRNQVNDQVSSVAAILPQLYSNPQAVTIPVGVDQGAFDMLRGTATLKNAQRDAIAAQKKQDINDDIYKSSEIERLKSLFDVAAAGPKTLAEERAKLAAFDLLGTGSTNPDDPRYKVVKEKNTNLDSVRKEYQSLNDVQNFSQVLSAANALSGALKDNGKVSDQELVRYSIQMIEPGMAVREGEQRAVANSQSIPDQLKSELLSALSGESSLGESAREGIKRLATRAYEAKRGLYDKATSYYQGLAQGRGLLGSDENIGYIGQAPSASEIFGAPANLGTSASPGQMPVPPSGYELTGKIDANGNYGIRRKL